MNLVMLIGRLGQDPEVGYTELGKAYANFSLATNERWTDANGQKQERTEWTRITLWGRVAEIAGQYLKKGSKVAIQGSLKTRSWTDRDGNQRKVTEVAGNNLEMLDSNGNGNGSGNTAKPAAPPRDDSSNAKPAMTAEKAAQPDTPRPSPNDSPFAGEDDMFPDFD